MAAVGASTRWTCVRYRLLWCVPVPSETQLGCESVVGRFGDLGGTGVGTAGPVGVFPLLLAGRMRVIPASVRVFSMLTRRKPLSEMMV